jgi:AcrR family transcriptional regulator
MLAAMSELARELGAERVTVAHVVGRAGVSRRTFYELFTDRESCFLEALDQAIARIAADVVPAYESEREWRERLRAGLTATLECFEREPDIAALCVVDALGAGPRALARRAQTLEALIGVVDQGRRVGTHASTTSRITAEGVVGAVCAVLHERLREQPPSSLIGLRGQLMSIVVLPYLGPEVAAAELTLKAQRPRGREREKEDPLKGLDMRLTYRTLRVLAAIAARPGANNREVASDAGVADQGQISKLLQRLEGLELIRNASFGVHRGEANAWTLTPRGEQLEEAVRARGDGFGAAPA